MGLAKGIFTVDTHVHAQRIAFKFKEKGLEANYASLGDDMYSAEPYSNAERLLYHMDRYQVDVAVIMPAFAMTNKINMEIIDKYPDRFVALAFDVETQRKSRSGEAPWTAEAAAKEIDELLSTGRYVGIGESFPRNRELGRKRLSWPERLEELCLFMELARKYKVTVHYHAGFPTGYAGGIQSSMVQGNYDEELANPLHCHELAALYPDVQIIMCHGGIEGSSYYMDYHEKCLNVAASHANVYLECGQWWAELYERPLKDPNIGAEKLLWGTDWGASCTPQSWMPGCVPETFCCQDSRLGPPAHQVDIYGWTLRELGRLNIPQDDLNLILGGNAVRLFNIKTPFTRLFKEYLPKTGR